MSQLAWYHSVPQIKGRDSNESRLFYARQNGDKIEFPPLGYASYLIEYLSAIGYPAEGERPWSEIKAWCEMTGTEMTPWEVQTVYDLFIHYSAERFKYGKDAYTPAPYCSDVNARRVSVGQNLKAMLVGNKR